MTALTIIVGGGKLEGKTLKRMDERIIKNFMDIIILAQPRNAPMSVYDVISFIHNKFHLLVSSSSRNNTERKRQDQKLRSKSLKSLIHGLDF